MLDILKQKNFTRVISEMSKSKVYSNGEVVSLKKNQQLTVHCINGGSRLLHGIEYLYFNLEVTGRFDRHDGNILLSGRESVSSTQMIVLLHQVTGEDSDTLNTYPIYCNGSFLSNGGWIKDSVLVLTEAYANFKQNLAAIEMNKAIQNLSIDGKVSAEIPISVSDAFSQVTEEDTTHDLRYIDEHFKIFENFIGL